MPQTSPYRRKRLSALAVVFTAAMLIVWFLFLRGDREESENRDNRPKPEPIAGLLLKAEEAIQRNESDEALKHLNAILARDPDHGMALLYRGHFASDRGDTDKALADWRRVSDDPPHIGGTARYLEAVLLLKSFQARKAEQLLLRATTLHPTYLEPRERLLTHYIEQLRAEEIRETLAGIRTLRPWKLEECALQVIAGRRFRTDEVGIQRMTAFAKADPNDRASRRALCRYHLESNRYDAAVTISRELLESDESDQAAAAILIHALFETNQRADSERLLRKYPLKNDSPIALWRIAGRHAFENENWRKAAYCFRRVVKHDPYDVAVMYSLGTALARLDKPEEADRVLKAAKRLDQVERQALQVIRGLNRPPKLLASTAVEIGEQLVELEYTIDAAAWFQQALKRTPRDRRARAGLARCTRTLRENGQLAGGDPQAQKKPSKLPTLPEWIRSGRKKPDTRKPPKVAGTTIGNIRLRDVHQEAGIGFRYFNGQSGFKYIIEGVGGGVAVLDFDRDGRPDVYFSQGAPLPPKKNDGRYTDPLFHNRGDGTFADISQPAGLGDPHFSQGAAVGDFDNDGFPDLFVANFGRNTLYHNNGDGTFSDLTDASGIAGDAASSCAAFADFNNDGLLDLYVVNYVADALRVCRNADGKVATCNPQNFAAEQDRLYLNRGDGTFKDVTESAGIVASGGKGLGIVTADFDGDGKIDIYVANDGTPNFLFRNTTSDGGELRFVNRGLVSGTAMNGQGRSEAGMGIACFDFDDDGRLDLFVTNFYGETNTLYLNRGNMLFVDATTRNGLAGPSRSVLGFGTQAVDLNLDGHADLVVANGDIDDYRAQGRPWKMRPQVFANRGTGRFIEKSAQSGDYFQQKYLGRGMARLDWNRDGRPDLIVVHHDRPAALLSNETSDAGHKVVLELHGVTSNREAIGAQILVTAGGRTRLHAICGGDGFAATNERRQFIGLGDADRIDKLEIRWPNGRIDRWSDLPADKRIVCIEGNKPQSHPIGEP